MIWGDQPYWEHKPRQEVYTDEHGVYHLPPLPSQPTHITVVAEGWMPDMRQIEPTMAPVDFHLKPGKTLRLRVVDDQGAPVSNVFFQVAGWRGSESLYNYDHPNVKDSKIPRHSDENGIYEWTWAPDDAVTFNISSTADFSNPKVSFTADDQEHVFKLQPKLHISGRVTDAKTGQPIDRFVVVPVQELAENLLVTLRPSAKTQTDGQYLLGDLERTDVAHRVRIEAEGYRSALSSPFHIGDHHATYDFQLEPAPPASGHVLDAQGNPLPGAKVYLATKTQAVDEPLRQKIDAFSDNFCLLSGPQGEFSFPRSSNDTRSSRFTTLAMPKPICSPTKFPAI